MRVVLDTNVIVSGLLWGGAPNRLLRWARDGVLQVICCEAVLAEVKRVLGYPKISRRIAALELTSPQVMAYLMNRVMHVPAPQPIPPVIRDDASDDLFLALAAENGARLIVSGDRHLLAVKEYKRVPIIAPGDAVDVVNELAAR